ncbi:MAG: MBL fold metallo-hydrolase [Desulfobacteraceae bacterium]|nr:MBL fold metallo-hydrolase [Desulfobacteraceae bacterium]
MIVKKLEVGPIMANCFIVGCEDTKQAVVIDPGDEADRILMELAKAEWKVTHLINTHGHFDHVGANKRMKDATQAILAIHPDDVPMLAELSRSAATFGLAAENSPEPDLLLNHGDEVPFGNITLQVIHTPGHSRGGICLYTKGHLFAGDTLFAGSIGRTDLPSGRKRLFCRYPLGSLRPGSATGRARLCFCRAQNWIVPDIISWGYRPGLK